MSKKMEADDVPSFVTANPSSLKRSQSNAAAHQGTLCSVPLFANGFQRYLNSEDFSDVVLVSKEGHEYKCHRLILAYASEYFAQMLSEMDDQPLRLPIKLQIPPTVTTPTKKRRSRLSSQRASSSERMLKKISSKKTVKEKKKKRKKSKEKSDAKDGGGVPSSSSSSSLRVTSTKKKKRRSKNEKEQKEEQNNNTDSNAEDKSNDTTATTTTPSSSKRNSKEKETSTKLVKSQSEHFVREAEVLAARTLSGGDTKEKREDVSTPSPLKFAPSTLLPSSSPATSVGGSSGGSTVTIAARVSEDNSSDTSNTEDSTASSSSTTNKKEGSRDDMYLDDSSEKERKRALALTDYSTSSRGIKSRRHFMRRACTLPSGINSSSDTDADSSEDKVIRIIDEEAGEAKRGHSDPTLNEASKENNSKKKGKTKRAQSNPEPVAFVVPIRDGKAATLPASLGEREEFIRKKTFLTKTVERLKNKTSPERTKRKEEEDSGQGGSGGSTTTVGSNLATGNTIDSKDSSNMSTTNSNGSAVIGGGGSPVPEREKREMVAGRKPVKLKQGSKREKRPDSPMASKEEVANEGEKELLDKGKETEKEKEAESLDKDKEKEKEKEDEMQLRKETIPRLQLEADDPENLFPLVLKFIYDGEEQIQIDQSNCMGLLALAVHYKVKELHARCTQFLGYGLDRKSAVTMLKKAYQFSMEETVTKCIDIIARNFAYIPTSRYMDLPYPIFYRLLEHEHLAVRAIGEYALYEIVSKYIHNHRDELSKAQQQNLLGTIRYRWMTTEQLNRLQTISNSYKKKKKKKRSSKRKSGGLTEEEPEEEIFHCVVPSEFLIEALMAKLQHSEMKEPGQEGEDGHHTVDSKLHHKLDAKERRMLPRQSYGIHFEYVADFDGRGIIRWIAKDHGRERWKNPHQQGLIKVTASSVVKGDIMNIVNKKPTELWSDDIPASWFSIDLGPNRSVMLTDYTLRHGGNYKGDSLRSWDLQGSLDGENWTTLKRHINDTSLAGPFASHTWQLKDIKVAYRHIRILQTGTNSSNHNFLVVSGIELYGELFET